MNPSYNSKINGCYISKAYKRPENQDLNTDILEFINFRKSFTPKELCEFAQQDHLQKQKRKAQKLEEDKELEELENECLEK